MTPQEIFDKAVGGIVKQGKPGFDYSRGVCSFYTRDGAKCAVGQLIPDQLAQQWEAAPEPFNTLLFESYPELFQHREFINDIRLSHDRVAVNTHHPHEFMEEYLHQMKKLAKRHNLEFKY
jgi:hypothetical protein